MFDPSRVSLQQSVYQRSCSQFPMNYAATEYTKPLAIIAQILYVSILDKEPCFFPLNLCLATFCHSRALYWAGSVLRAMAFIITDGYC